MKKFKITKRNIRNIAIVLAFIVSFTGAACDKLAVGNLEPHDLGKVVETETESSVNSSFKYSSIPEYSGKPCYIVNNNNPYFSEKEIKNAKSSFKQFSDLDNLGRCGVATASIGKDLLPHEDRSSIGMVKPSGWHTYRFDDIISDKYLYNRCHLIAFCLSGENANEKNLVTGTRAMNVDGMLDYETETVKYVEKTGNHVLYRVTPIFEGSDLVCRGVLMEAYSVEDNGKGVCFNVYCYNNQPGIKIDYSTGEAERL